MISTEKDLARPFTRSERRTVLAAVKTSRTMQWKDLDRLLLEACRTPARLASLVRTLHAVRLVGAENDDLLGPSLELMAMEESAGESEHFSLYADRVRRLPRLTREQEQRMARRLEFAQSRLVKEIDVRGLPAETRDSVLRSANCAGLIAALKEAPSRGGPAVKLPCQQLGSPVQTACSDYNLVRGRFVERNLYLVIGMSTAYRTYGLPMMDLVQEANASLIRAVEKFDWRKDVRFQTYAAFWVRQAIERLITANRGIVRVPNYIQQKLRRLRREGKLARNPRDVDLREVSRQFEASPEAAARLMETDRNWFSLDAPLSDEGSSISSVLAAEETEQVMSPSERMALSQRLDEVMGENLTEQERRILALRFGLGGAPPKTLDEIGAQMRVSRERIRQLQVKALDKLHKPRLLEELKDFI